MNGVILAEGKRAEIPYRVAILDRDVYSVEELSYAIFQCAQFLDASIQDAALLRWLAEECGLVSLARALTPYISRLDRLAEFCSVIFDSNGILTEEEKDQSVEILRAGEGLEKFEQRKARADFLMESGRLYRALGEYRKILEELPEAERNLRARIEHSCGVIHCKLFHFALGAECFKRAEALTEDPAYFKDYLAAVRLYLPEADYVSFVAKHPEAYEYSLELEQDMEEIRASYEENVGREQIERLRNLREEAGEALFANEAGPIDAVRAASDPSADAFLRELQATTRGLRGNYRTNLAR